eukprot:CAMPEP_0172440836 /NCGR_PEP_ID=MMETSP1065-20121228/1461_1 /TAXON_ID=265537 /ORGANISM="Amphiprora paludosa, Strain CCMP125" /LENGTH=131 /DNA_ID=CAMNT_0013189905 /DNA_START=67 /DNA_END=462 /DNA_ORIENTATION=+
MASRAVTIVARRGAALSKRSYHASALQMGGMPPPLPPFARSPIRTELIPENSDTVWDDGVAPELALDFDMPNVSTRTALMWWGSAITTVFMISKVLQWTVDQDEFMPVVLPYEDIVDKNWADFDECPLEEE